MAEITNGDVTVAYRTRGEGTPVVLLMGLGLPGRMWQQMTDRLVDDDFLVIIPDNRGTGHSDAPLPPYSLAEFAEDVALILDAEGIDRAIVCGVSFGGMIAQHVALNHPDRVAGLVLAATTCGVPTGRFPRLRAIYLLLKMVFASTTVTLEEGRELLAHPESGAELRTLFQRWDAILEELPTPPRAVVGHLLAAALHHTGHQLHRIDVPTRVVTGDSDILIPPQNSEILARLIPGAQLRVVDNAGHVFIQEHPESFLDCVLEVRDEICPEIRPSD